MANVEGLVARKTGKSTWTWYYRLAVPTRDQRRAGCKEIWQSLRTSDQAAAIERLPDAIRSAKSKLGKRLNVGSLQIDAPEAPIRTLKSDDIARLSVKLADLHYLSVKERDFVQRAALFEKANADEKSFFEGRQVPLPRTAFMDMLLEDGERPLADFLSYYWWNFYKERTLQLRSALSVGDASEGLTHLDQHLARLGAAVIAKDQRLLLSRAIMQAEIDALRDIKKTDDSRYQALTDKLAAAKTDVQPQHSTPILSVAAVDWISEKSVSSWSPRRKDACRATISLFLEIVGDKPVSSYTKGDARDFKAVLSDLPPNRSKLSETRGLGAREAACRARELALPPMLVVNINKQITIVSGLFDWLVAHYDAVTANPFAKTTIAVRSLAREERDPFTLSELKAIFTAPIFTGCESERHWNIRGQKTLRGSAKFWVPLLGLYTGARLNELCKLRVTDIRSDEGLPYIDINTEKHDDRSVDPGVKTSASSRRVPVHRDLNRFGFAELVAARSDAGCERLFPELRPDAYGKLSDRFGKHFARFLKSIGIKRDKIDFHSFRHTWTDACRNSRMSLEVILALKGEALQGTLARYGHGKTDIEILDEGMQKLHFKGLDLSHLAVQDMETASSSP